MIFAVPFDVGLALPISHDDLLPICRCRKEVIYHSVAHDGTAEPFSVHRQRRWLTSFELLLIGCLFWLGGNAAAGPITYQHKYEAGKQNLSGPFLGLSGSGASVSWTFDLLDTGFNPLAQDIVAATIALHFKHEGGLLDFSEVASLKLGSNTFNFEVSDGITRFTLDSLLALTSTGKLHSTLTATGGEFYFKSATLAATAVDKVIATPDPVTRLSEPATLSLFGISLLSLAFNRMPRMPRSAPSRKTCPVSSPT